MIKLANKLTTGTSVAKCHGFHIYQITQKEITLICGVAMLFDIRNSRSSLRKRKKKTLKLRIACWKLGDGKLLLQHPRICDHNHACPLLR
jgi:hypothetical protein